MRKERSGIGFGDDRKLTNKVVIVFNHSILKGTFILKMVVKKTIDPRRISGIIIYLSVCVIFISKSLRDVVLLVHHRCASSGRQSTVDEQAIVSW